MSNTRPHDDVYPRDLYQNPLICPLTKAPVGQDLRLCQLCKGRKMARRLAELGLTPGVCLRIVQDAGGPLLLSVRNSRVALGRGIADKLSVEVLGADRSETADQTGMRSSS
jgi:ferrous iron transport protein A